MSNLYIIIHGRELKRDNKGFLLLDRLEENLININKEILKSRGEYMKLNRKNITMAILSKFIENNMEKIENVST